jgi:hypothetical protein
VALSDEYLDKLRVFYDNEHISVRGFECDHRFECEQDVKGSILLRGAEGYVGPRYGEAMKIVFMSLDIGNQTEDEDRTLLGRRRIFENLPTLNSHLAGTLAILQALFSEDLIVPQDDPWPFFVLLNAAKCSRSCCAKKVHDRLYDRCRAFAYGEISLLDPDIVVTQGKKAKAVLGEMEEISDTDLDKSICLNTRSSTPSREDLVAARHYICFSRINERSVVTMHTPHPTDYGRGWWKEFKDKLSVCAWLARQLVKCSA